MAAAAAPLLSGQRSPVQRRLRGVSAQAGQGFTLQQPQPKVAVAVGETLTLNCITSGVAGPGPVMWLKGWGSGNKTVYDQSNEDPSSRVTRAVNESDTDFTIRIRNVQPDDVGTYYCVKFVKGSTGVDEVFRRGNGTEVSVQASSWPFACTGGSTKVEWAAPAQPGQWPWAASHLSLCSAVQGPLAPPVKSWMQRAPTCPARAARRRTTSTTPTCSPCPWRHGVAGARAQPPPSMPASG
ncbi:tyrosine-protein phosphatase non-receptor type substrate 1-like isoform X4 [Agelaius tricolor]|uniref:tyrosine-protein phosphatase non-receptor type substrate 1-like isoform X4 n=1 Tax=Agelaius tricolor TaxID=9191 RepID=UPI0039F211F7